jgi:hypothetical protein
MDELHALSGPPRSLVSRLFLVQYNVILVLGAALFALALASPWPLVFAAVAELLWLGIGSSAAGVRHWLDEHESAVGQRGVGSEPARASTTLDAEYARRLATLERAIAKVRELGGPRPAAAFAIAVARLETLRPLYAGLCETHQRIGRFLSASTEAALLAEADRLKATFAAEKDLGLRLTLKQALGSATRRIEHRRSMVDLQRGIGVKLESIERSMAYYVSQGAMLVANTELADDVEVLLAEVGPSINVDVEPPSLRPPPA